MCAAAGWPTRALCEARRTAARRQDDLNDAHNMRRSWRSLPEIRDAGRRNNSRNRAWTFELANDRGTNRARFIGVETGVQVGRRDRHQDRKSDSRNRRDQGARWHMSRCRNENVHWSSCFTLRSIKCEDRRRDLRPRAHRRTAQSEPRSRRSEKYSYETASQRHRTPGSRLCWSGACS
jgi:hypothetical protein